MQLVGWRKRHWGVCSSLLRKAGYMACLDEDMEATNLELQTGKLWWINSSGWTDKAQGLGRGDEVWSQHMTALSTYLSRRLWMLLCDPPNDIIIQQINPITRETQQSGSSQENSQHKCLQNWLFSKITSLLFVYFTCILLFIFWATHLDFIEFKLSLLVSVTWVLGLLAGVTRPG